jgi:AraC family transcriptional regulator
MDGRIFHIKKELAENLAHHWTVAEMAAKVGLSPLHFQKLFKQVTGVSPIHYLNDLRLEKARELLETSFLQIKQIGVQTGLTNDSHFSRDFKRKYGTTPTKYRNHWWQAHQDPHGDGQQQEVSPRKTSS